MFNNKLPKELVNLIFQFDLTYHKEFYNCIREIKLIIFKKYIMINRINSNFWNNNMPESIYNYHDENIKLSKYKKWY